MDEPQTALPPGTFDNALPQLVGNSFVTFPQPPSHPDAATFSSHLDPSLQALDGGAAFQSQFASQLQDPSHVHGQHLQLGNPYATPTRSSVQSRFREVRSHGQAPRSQRNARQGAQFGILAPQGQMPDPAYLHHDVLRRIEQENDMLNEHISPEDGKKQGGHFPGMKAVPNPPNLEEWRQRLFDVNEPITLTEDEFQTYFPHVDNIYSHRSTQKYKRKPFVSHYWDCRLKGRPPGTPKSEDPNKRKRKRQARERDLCDVKIKITEYFPNARALMGHENGDDDDSFFDPGEAFDAGLGQPRPPSQMYSLPSANAQPQDVPGANGERYYTIQRVNGNGGNGKGDGVEGPHKHTLEESDRIKKNSLQRAFAKEEKEKKKVQKTYHKRATGPALATAKRHSKDHDLKLYGGCFCPFVQRVWIALELKGMNYQYIEVDPYKKPESLLAINPQGLVPALRHGDWGCYESTVLLEFLEDLHPERPLLPANDPQKRAHSRLWADHINRKIVPAFYHYIQAQDTQKQIAGAAELRKHLDTLVSAADATGPFFLGAEMTFVDVQLAPWLLRLGRVLKPYRGWPDPEPGTRWAKWVEAVEGNVDVRATTSTDELYLDSYERYAENRPNTSQVANAVNEGRGLP